MATFSVTPAHATIFGFIDNPDGGNGIIEAVAGSGKTSTTVECWKRIPSDKRVLALAFNKKIAEELQRRAPLHVECKTLNALGHVALTKFLSETRGIKAKLDTNKTRDIGRRLFGDDWNWLGGKAAKLVQLAKSSGIMPDTGTVQPIVSDSLGAWSDLADKHDVFDADVKDPSRFIDAARDVLRASMNELSVIDFDDQLLMTYALGATMPRYDWVFVDEAQDLSPLQHELVAGALAANGRLVAVGDPHQAIYGFRGADSNSMETLRKRFHCTPYPLHVSYRCAQSVVRAAQGYVKHIQAHAGAPEGSVVTVAKGVLESGIKPGDMVVCRFTAPMVSAAFQLLKNGTPATILGRDIGSNLIALLRKMTPESIEDAHDKVNAWEKKETAVAVRKEDEAKQAEIEDKASVLRMFLDSCEAVDDVFTRIETMFADDSDAGRVTCCTIHKSKGLEADRVFVLNVHKMPSKWAKQPWQKEQEINLIYVAFTRAKTHLQFVTDEAASKRGNITPMPIAAAQAAPQGPQTMVPVPGNTYPVKDQLKAMGARWDAAAKLWSVPANRFAEAQALVRPRPSRSTTPKPANPTYRAPVRLTRKFRPCGYPGCTPGFCDECDGVGGEYEGRN